MSSGTDFPSPTSGLPLAGPKQETGATQLNDYRGNEIAPTPVTIPGAATTVVGPDAFAAPAVVGVLTTYAREDHDHGLPSAPAVPASAAPALTLGTANSAGADTGHFFPPNSTIAAFDATAPTNSAVGDAAATGSAVVAARRDHLHGRESFATPAIVLGTAAAAGVATTPIRSDSTIVAFDGTVPVTQAMGDAAATGAAVVSARRDHKHGMPSFATPAIVLGTAAAAGVATTPIRSDSTIVAFDGTVPVTQAFGDAAATGAAVVAARRDHKHGMPATPASMDWPGANSPLGPYQLCSPFLRVGGGGGVPGWGLNVLVAVPIFLRAGNVLSNIGVWVATTVSTAKYRFGLYASSAGVPSGAPLADSGQVDVSTAGAFRNLGATFYTGPVGTTGWYWIAVVAQTAEPNVDTCFMDVAGVGVQGSSPTGLITSQTPVKHNAAVSGALPTFTPAVIVPSGLKFPAIFVQFS